MILHHVAHGAGLVVELAAPFDAELLADRDLHVTDAAAAPQRFEQGVAEAQRQQVLHRLLAQVMIDAVDLHSRRRSRRRSRLMCSAEARSWPSGFSSTTRAAGVTRFAACRFWHMLMNSAGAVDRKNTRTSAGFWASLAASL